VPTVEWTFSVDTIAIVNGTNFSLDEVAVVEILYKSALPVVTYNSVFTDFKTIVADTTLDSTYYDNLVNLTGTLVKLVVTMPLISTIPDGKFFYFKTKGGAQNQTRLLCQGSDKFSCEGINPSSALLPEMWVGKGEYIWVYVLDGVFEVVGCSSSILQVGERFPAGFKSHPNTLPEDDGFIDGDEWPRVWWWVNNVLPATHRITNDALSIGGTRAQDSTGQFIIHSTLKKMRMPNTQGLSERGLKSFNTYGTDADRAVDYPGGYQEQQLMKHKHEQAVGALPSTLFGRGILTRLMGLYNGTGTGRTDLVSDPVDSSTAASIGGVENRVKNIGIIFLRRV